MRRFLSATFLAGASLTAASMLAAYPFCMDGPGRGLPFAITHPGHGSRFLEVPFAGDSKQGAVLDIKSIVIDFLAWAAVVGVSVAFLDRRRRAE